MEAPICHNKHHHGQWIYLSDHNEDGNRWDKSRDKTIDEGADNNRNFGKESRNTGNCKNVSGGRITRRKKDGRGCSYKMRRIKVNTNLARFIEEMGFVPWVVSNETVSDYMMKMTNETCYQP